MNVKNVEKENGAAKVTIEIARDEFQTALDKAYAKIRKDIMIPGFRKGKAPRKFVERMYGSQVFYEDAVNEIFPEIYEAAIVKQELKAVGQPSVTDMQTPEDGSVVLTVSTELYPEVTLGEYKGIEVPKETVSISKAEVDAELGRMQDRNARIETVDREAKTGDTVILDFEGFVDGKPFDGGKAEGYTLTLGSGAFIPGFEDQLVGLKAGEEKAVEVTFPESYTKELAGKGVDLFAPPALKFFLYNDISRETFYNNPDCLENYIQLDDNDLWTALKVWSAHSDKVLSTLSLGMINRNIFKVEISTEPFSEERKKEITRQISKQLDIPLSEAGYFISTPGIEKNMYDPADDSIDILYNDGSTKNIAEASDMLNISLLSKKVKKYYLCYQRLHR